MYISESFSKHLRALTATEIFKRITPLDKKINSCDHFAAQRVPAFAGAWLCGADKKTRHDTIYGLDKPAKVDKLNKHGQVSHLFIIITNEGNCINWFEKSSVIY